tara:strand:- start:954 stop:1754 length:801 start_codon:yes stop_codon:yes gene_type:complete
MIAFWGMLQKELKCLWGAFPAWVVLFAFNLVISILFWLRLLQYEKVVQNYEHYQDQVLMARLNFDDVIIKYLFMNMAMVLLFLVPVMTMRAFAEEKKLKTYEWLRAQPVPSVSLLLAKFASAFSFVFVLCVMGLIYPLVLESVGSTSLIQESVIDWPATGIGFFGIGMLGGLFVAIGIFFSAFNENQLLSALMAFLFLLIIWFLKSAGGEMGTPWGPLLAYLSPLGHLDSFSRGTLRFEDLVYFFSATFFFLWLTHKRLESDGWGG